MGRTVAEALTPYPDAQQAAAVETLRMTGAHAAVGVPASAAGVPRACRLCRG